MSTIVHDGSAGVAVIGGGIHDHHSVSSRDRWTGRLRWLDCAARPITLHPRQRADLEAIVRRGVAPYRQVLRARIVLLAADGAANTAIARLAGCVRGHRPQVASQVRRAGHGRACRPAPVWSAPPVRSRCGGPGQGAGLRTTRRELACRCRGGAARNWPATQLDAGIVRHRCRLPRVRRWLADDALKPWQHRSWIFPTRPAFRGQGQPCAGPVRPDLSTASRLGSDEYVSPPTKNPASRPAPHPLDSTTRARPAAMRVENEYQRGGTMAYLAAYDVHRARVIGRCEPTTGIAPFTRLVDQVMTQRALRHRRPRVLDRRQRLLPPRLGRRRPPEQRLPQRDHGPPARSTPPGSTRSRSSSPSSNAKSSPPTTSTSLDHLAQRLTAFETHYNPTATTIRLALHPHRSPPPTDPTGRMNTRRTNGDAY